MHGSALADAANDAGDGRGMTASAGRNGLARLQRLEIFNGPAQRADLDQAHTGRNGADGIRAVGGGGKEDRGTGGILFIDTRDQQLNFDRPAGGNPDLKRLLGGIETPPLIAMPADHVLTK